LAICLAGGSVAAADVVVTLTDGSGAPVEDAVVSLHPTGGAVPPAPREVAVMDQRDLQFVPHVLPVRVGTPVEFPNTDKVRHHVYSFSPAKRFELRLYKGRPAAPVEFDQPGVVTLGCNIHDWMLGFIYVVDAPYFSRSGADGVVRLSPPPGEYQLKVWHPRLAKPDPLTFGTVRNGEGEVSRTIALALIPQDDTFSPPTEVDDRFKRFKDR